jgi:hypothetical protein
MERKKTKEKTMPPVRCDAVRPTIVGFEKKERSSQRRKWWTLSKFDILEMAEMSGEQIGR